MSLVQMFLVAGGATLLTGGLGAGKFVRDIMSLRAPLLYGFGLFEFARAMQTLSGQIDAMGLFNREMILAQYPDWSGARLNCHLHMTHLSGPNERAITAPNNDTLYTSAVLDLAQGPVEVSVPDSSDRYLSVALMDMFNDQIGYIGTRATEGRGGLYWLIGPGQEVDVPPDVIGFRSPVNDLWMLARIFVAGESDLGAAQEKQRQISVRPVDASHTGRLFATKATTVSDAKNFVEVVNELLGRSPITGHSKRAARFGQFGIRPGDLDAFNALSSWRKATWSVVVPRVEERITRQIQGRQAAQSGWMTPPPILGNYGDNDEVRAGVALVGFGALSIDEAMYFRASTDEQGVPLDGRKRYRMCIPAEGVPVDAFWSISMYKPATSHRVYFYENEINRYAINSASEELTRQPNGEIILALQPDRPKDPSVVWMPTPEGPFQVFFRAYLPGQAIKSGAWQVPPLVAHC